MKNAAMQVSSCFQDSVFRKNRQIRRDIPVFYTTLRFRFYAAAVE